LSKWVSHSKFGWVIVFSMLVIQTISSGLGFYNMSVYMSFFVKEFGFPLDLVSISVSLFFVSGGIAGLFVARILSLWDVRVVMIFGAFLSGLALFMIGYATSLAELYLLFTLFGIGNTGVSIVVATTLITQWFPGANRSVALSISSTGLSLGGVLLTPYTAYLLDSRGISETMPLLGLLFFLLITPVVFLFIRPARINVEMAKPVSLNDDEYRAAIKSRFFVCITLGYVLIMGAQVGGISHLYNRIDSVGGLALATMCVQALTLASISGRLIGGWLLTRISIKPFLFCNLLIQFAGLTLIGFADTPVFAVIASVLFGVSVGNLLMLQPLWLAEVFSLSVYPRAFALSNSFSVLGVAFGPFLLGLLYVNSGYSFAYFFASAISLIALFIIILGRDYSKTENSISEPV